MINRIQNVDFIIDGHGRLGSYRRKRHLKIDVLDDTEKTINRLINYFTPSDRITWDEIHWEYVDPISGESMIEKVERKWFNGLFSKIQFHKGNEETLISGCFYYQYSTGRITDASGSVVGQGVYFNNQLTITIKNTDQ